MRKRANTEWNISTQSCVCEQKRECARAREKSKIIALLLLFFFGFCLYFSLIHSRHSARNKYVEKKWR